MSTQPTQVRRPWRTTVRSIIQAVVGLAAAVPFAVTAVEGDRPGLLGVAGTAAVAVSGAITRLMAVPQVNAWLTAIGLGATPKPTEVPPPAVDDRPTLFDQEPDPPGKHAADRDT